MRWSLVLLCACATNGEHIVPPAQSLLNDARAMTSDDACKLLSDALASGDYSTNRLQADNLSAMNDEYQIGHARETYCRMVEKRASKLKDLATETDVVTLKAVAVSEGEDEGVRRQAAQRLLEVLPEVTDKDRITKLTQVEVKGELPAWYVAMRVEELIEQRYWQLHQDTSPAVAELQQKVQALATARSQLAKAALDGSGLDAARADYAAREAAVCAAFAALDSTAKRAALPAIIANVMDPILHERIEVIAAKGCAP
jgi:hypothetical protein